MTWVIQRRHLPRNPRSAAARVVVPRVRQLSDETVVANPKLQRRTESYRRHSKEKVGEANRTWTKCAMSKTQEADACGHCGMLHVVAPRWEIKFKGFYPGVAHLPA